MPTTAKRPLRSDVRLRSRPSTFELDNEQQAAVNAMMGIDADRARMEASARRFKAEVDAAGL